MSTAESPTSSQAVGHQGAQVDITQRRAHSRSTAGSACWCSPDASRGWWCPSSTTPRGCGCRSSSSSWSSPSLVIVPPGKTSVIQFFGRYVGTVRRPGLLVGGAADGAPPGQRPGPQLRDQPAQGQRRRRQPRRDRRDRRLAGRRHREVDVRRRGATRTSSRCRPSRRCATSPTTHPYDDATGAGTLAARLHRRRRRRARRARSPSGSRSPGSRSSRSGSPTSPTPRRSPRRCCSASRPTPSSRPGRGSSRARSAWCELALTPARAEDGVVSLDEERKAAMVSNLLVVLCGDRRPRRSSTPARCTREPSAGRCCSGSTRRSTTRSPAGPTTSSAASTPTSRCCCAAR